MRYLPIYFLTLLLGICCAIGCRKDMTEVVRQQEAAAKAAKLAGLDSTGHPGDTSHHPGDTTHHPGDTTHHPGDTTHHPGDTTRPHWPPIDSPRVPRDSPRHPIDTPWHPHPDSTRRR